MIQDEWRFLLAGGTSKPKEMPNPAHEWLSARSWNEILTLASLSTFANFAEDFKNHLDGFKRIFDSPDPHRWVLLDFSLTVKAAPHECVIRTG